jgi:hypothetical protein
VTRRQSLALDPRPTGWRHTVTTRLLAGARRAHVALNRLEARMVRSTAWMDGPRLPGDQPGPSADDIEMQPEVTP